MRNRRAIRHLEIGWAYGVSIQSGRQNIRGILHNIEKLEGSDEGEAEMHRQQLIDIAKRLEMKTIRLSRLMFSNSPVGHCLLTIHCPTVVRTINLLVSNQSLQCKAVKSKLSSASPKLLPQLSQSIYPVLMVEISGIFLTQTSILPKNYFQIRPPMYTLASPKP